MRRPVKYSGTRTERLELPRQLRTDPDLAENIRLVARMRRMPITLLILHWVIEKVEEEMVGIRQVSSAVPKRSVGDRQETSGDVGMDAA